MHEGDIQRLAVRVLRAAYPDAIRFAGIFGRAVCALVRRQVGGIRIPYSADIALGDGGLQLILIQIKQIVLTYNLVDLIQLIVHCLPLRHVSDRLIKGRPGQAHGQGDTDGGNNQHNRERGTQ